MKHLIALTLILFLSGCASTSKTADDSFDVFTPLRFAAKVIGAAGRGGAAAAGAPSSQVNCTTEYYGGSQAYTVCR